MSGVTRIRSGSRLQRGAPAWPARAKVFAARRVLRGTVDRLENALNDEVKVLAREIDERAGILETLDDPPGDLAELRGVLMNEHEWRVREGARIEA